MSSKKIFPGLAARLEFIVEDSDGLPVPSLAHGDTSSAGYRNCTDGEVSSTTSVSLTSSVAATAAVSAGQFVTINSARGHYAIDVPSGAAGSSLDYAEAVVVFTAGHTVTPVQHEIDFLLDTVIRSYVKLSVDLQYAIDDVVSQATDIQSRLPEALVSGRMDVYVGAMAANVVTASALAADAVTEIQSSLSTELGTGTWLTNIGDTRIANLNATVSSRSSQTAVDDLPTNSEFLTALAAADDLTLAAISTESSKITAIQTILSGITSLGNWLRRLARKDVGTAGMVTAESEINTGGTSTFVGTTDNLEAIKDAGGGGGLTPEIEVQIDRIEAQTAKLSGTAVTVTGNVKPGGQIVVKQSDDHTVALGNPVTVPVDDVGGSLHALMAAVGVGNLSIVAIRGVDPASRIAGTVAALSYASNVLTVTLEFTAAETVKGVVGPAYNYDVIKTATPTRTYFSGRLTVTRDAR